MFRQSDRIAFDECGRRIKAARREQLKAAAGGCCYERGAVGAAGQGHRRASRAWPRARSSTTTRTSATSCSTSRAGRWSATPRSGPPRSARSTGRRPGCGSRSSLGVPTGPDDEDSRLLYEIDALTGTSPAFRGPQRRLLRPPGPPLRVADRGRRRRRRARARARPRPRIARGLVAMEDGLGLQVVLGHGGIDQQAAAADPARICGAAGRHRTRGVAASTVRPVS